MNNSRFITINNQYLESKEVKLKHIAYCSFCEKEVFANDEYIDVDGDILCIESIKNMNSIELLEWLNIEIKNTRKSHNEKKIS